MSDHSQYKKTIFIVYFLFTDALIISVATR